MKIDCISSSSQQAWATKVPHFRLQNDQMSLTVSALGGCITSLSVPDRAGVVQDIALGFDDIANYQTCGYSPCAMVGRYANRIAQGRFMLNGSDVQVTANDGPHHLHGGARGFHRYIWEAELLENAEGLKLSRFSPDGEEGFPGNLTVSVFYRLTDQNELVLTFEAVCDQDTLCNLTAHMAVNLGGCTCQSCLDHELQVFSDNFCEASADGIPTGRLCRVENTAMDFQTFHPLCEQMKFTDPQLRLMGGYDHNWNLSKSGMGPAFILRHPKSGRVMSCYTDMPCVHIYTANTLNGSVVGKQGASCPQYGAFFTETQYAPDSPNHPDWAQPLLRAGDVWRHTTIYRFSVDS